ncbi:YebW family protein [Escherichia coli]|nr:YebW family protein [Escherichia coli]
MTSAFALVMTVFLITGEPQNVITGIYDSKSSCIQVRDEQKIPGECLPVKKVSLYLNNETPAGW